MNDIQDNVVTSSCTLWLPKLADFLQTTHFGLPIATLADLRPQIQYTFIIYHWKRQKSLQIHGSQS